MVKNKKEITTIRVIPSVGKIVKFGDIESPTFFFNENILCIKVPNMKDEHGEVNCVNLEDGKGYFIKEWQEVKVIKRVNFSA